MKIQLEIKSCMDCPFFRQERYYTSDSWEHAHNWFCDKKNGKEIAGYVNWNEEKDIEIPKWCPAKVKTKTKLKK